MAMSNEEIAPVSGHGMSYIENALFKLLGVDKKAEELYALEQMSKQLGNKPYYRQKERY